MVRGPQPLRADCDSGFLGVLGGSMVQSIDVFKVSIASLYTVRDTWLMSRFQGTFCTTCTSQLIPGFRESEGKRERRSNSDEEGSVLVFRTKPSMRLLPSTSWVFILLRGVRS